MRQIPRAQSKWTIPLGRRGRGRPPNNHHHPTTSLTNFTKQMSNKAGARSLQHFMEGRKQVINDSGEDLWFMTWPGRDLFLRRVVSTENVTSASFLWIALGLQTSLESRSLGIRTASTFMISSRLAARSG